MSMQGIPRPKHKWYIVMRAAVKGTSPCKEFCVFVEAETSAKAIIELYKAFDCVGVTRVELQPCKGHSYTNLQSYIKMPSLENLTWCVLYALNYIHLTTHSAGPITLDKSDVNELVYLLKCAKYTRGEYVMPVPPVCTAGWTYTDWVNYVDNNGEWR